MAACAVMLSPVLPNDRTAAGRLVGCRYNVLQKYHTKRYLWVSVTAVLENQIRRPVMNCNLLKNIFMAGVRWFEGIQSASLFVSWVQFGFRKNHHRQPTLMMHCI
jgi:hypothetical protein